MKKMRNKVGITLVVSILVFLIDQISKLVVLNYKESLILGVKVFDGFKLVYVENRGVSFGFFADLDISFYLGFLSFLIIFYILYLIKVANNTFEVLGLSMIVGGAYGNGYDRIVNKYVVDFIDIYAKSYHWPAFNFADTFITLGVFFYFWQILRFRRD